MQMEARFLRRSVHLLGVAPPACGHDVLPYVEPTSGTRQHVIQVLGGRPAVLALPPIPSEHRAPRERRVGAERNVNEVTETNHGWGFQRDPFTVEDRAVRLHDLGFLLEHEHDGSPRGNDRERQFGRVEDEGASHGGECTRCSRFARPARRANHNVVIFATRGGVAAMPGVANRGRAGRPAANPAPPSLPLPISYTFAASRWFMVPSSDGPGRPMEQNYWGAVR